VLFQEFNLPWNETGVQGLGVGCGGKRAMGIAPSRPNPRNGQNCLDVGFLCDAHRRPGFRHFNRNVGIRKKCIDRGSAAMIDNSARPVQNYARELHSAKHHFRMLRN